MTTNVEHIKDKKALLMHIIYVYSNINCKVEVFNKMFYNSIIVTSVTLYIRRYSINHTPARSNQTTPTDDIPNYNNFS